VRSRNGKSCLFAASIKELGQNDFQGAVFNRRSPGYFLSSREKPGFSMSIFFTEQTVLRAISLIIIVGMLVAFHSMSRQRTPRPGLAAPGELDPLFNEHIGS
jgi:hypothetical protein